MIYTWEKEEVVSKGQIGRKGGKLKKHVLLHIKT